MRAIAATDNVGDTAVAVATAIAIEDLLPGLTGGDAVCCVSTALLLSELGDGARSAVPALLEVLERGCAGSEREVRWAIAYALGRIGPAAADAVPALVRLLETGDADIRAEAQAAIDRICADGTVCAAAV